MAKSISEADLYEFNMEYQLTKAMGLFGRCGTCADYFFDRQKVLRPAILALAVSKEQSPSDILVDFRNRYHQRHTELEEIVEEKMNESQNSGRRNR